VLRWVATVAAPVLRWVATVVAQVWLWIVSESETVTAETGSVMICDGAALDRRERGWLFLSRPPAAVVSFRHGSVLPGDWRCMPSLR